MDMQMAAANTRQLQACRTLSAILFGSTAGVLALTGWQGFVFYFVSSVLLSLYLNVLFGSKAKDWFESSKALWTSGVAGNAFTFALFWTLAYGLVHVY